MQTLSFSLLRPSRDSSLNGRRFSGVFFFFGKAFLKQILESDVLFFGENSWNRDLVFQKNEVSWICSKGSTFLV